MIKEFPSENSRNLDNNTFEIPEDFDPKLYETNENHFKISPKNSRKVSKFYTPNNLSDILESKSNTTRLVPNEDDFHDIENFEFNNHQHIKQLYNIGMTDIQVRTDRHITCLVAFLKKCPIIEQMGPKISEEKLEEISQVLCSQKLKPGDLQDAKGNPSRKVYFLLEGKIGLTAPSAPETEWKKSKNYSTDSNMYMSIKSPGDFFGEWEPLYGEKRSVNLISLTPTIVFTLNIDHFRNIIGKYLKDKYSEKIKFQKKLYLFRSWNDYNIGIFMEHVKQVRMPKNYIIFDVGSIDKFIYIVQEGFVDLSYKYNLKDQKPAIIKPKDKSITNVGGKTVDKKALKRNSEIDAKPCKGKLIYGYEPIARICEGGIFGDDEGLIEDSPKKFRVTVTSASLVVYKIHKNKYLMNIKSLEAFNEQINMYNEKSDRRLGQIQDNIVGNHKGNEEISKHQKLKSFRENNPSEANDSQNNEESSILKNENPGGPNIKLFKNCEFNKGSFSVDNHAKGTERMSIASHNSHSRVKILHYDPKLMSKNFDAEHSEIAEKLGWNLNRNRSFLGFFEDLNKKDDSKGTKGKQPQYIEASRQSPLELKLKVAGNFLKAQEKRRIPENSSVDQLYNKTVMLQGKKDPQGRMFYENPDFEMNEGRSEIIKRSVSKANSSNDRSTSLRRDQDLNRNSIIGKDRIIDPIAQLKNIIKIKDNLSKYNNSFDPGQDISDRGRDKSGNQQFDLTEIDKYHDKQNSGNKKEGRMKKTLDKIQIANNTSFVNNSMLGFKKSDLAKNNADAKEEVCDNSNHQKLYMKKSFGYRKNAFLRTKSQINNKQAMSNIKSITKISSHHDSFINKGLSTTGGRVRLDSMKVDPNQAFSKNKSGLMNDIEQMPVLVSFKGNNEDIFTNSFFDMFSQKCNSNIEKNDKNRRKDLCTYNFSMRRLNAQFQKKNSRAMSESVNYSANLKESSGVELAPIENIEIVKNKIEYVNKDDTKTGFVRNKQVENLVLERVAKVQKKIIRKPSKVGVEIGQNTEQEKTKEKSEEKAEENRNNTSIDKNLRRISTVSRIDFGKIEMNNGINHQVIDENVEKKPKNILDLIRIRKVYGDDEG